MFIKALTDKLKNDISQAIAFINYFEFNTQLIFKKIIDKLD